METILNIDLGVIIAALAPTIAIIAAGWVAKRDATKSLQQGEAIHTLVNDALTKEKSKTLVLLKLLLERGGGKNDTALFQVLKAQAEELEQEIVERNNVAQAISEREG